MSASAPRALSVLAPEDIEFFRAKGYVRVKEAFPRELALKMQDEIWEELRVDHAVVRDDRARWEQLRKSPKRAKHSALNERLATERFVGAITDLLGYDTWRRPGNWGGFLVTFPNGGGKPWDVPDQLWHWDGSPSAEGLLIFSFYSEVRAGGGGTLLLEGSPRVIEALYGSLSPDQLAQPHKVHRRMLSRFDPALEALMGKAREPVPDRIETFMNRTVDVRGVPCRVVELTGEPGDAVYCNLGILHSPAPNGSEVARIMRAKFLLLE